MLICIFIRIKEIKGKIGEGRRKRRRRRRRRRRGRMGRRIELE